MTVIKEEEIKGAILKPKKKKNPLDIYFRKFRKQ